MGSFLVELEQQVAYLVDMTFDRQKASGSVGQCKLVCCREKKGVEQPQQTQAYHRCGRASQHAWMLRHRRHW